MASTEPEHRRDDDDDNAPAEDEDTGAQVAPIVKLEEVAVTTGEEDEDPILDLKAKLYRFDKEGNQWKERGGGNVRLLKHKVTGKVRLVMRQSKTLKICANHLVHRSLTVQEHSGNEKSCVWHASDFADGELKDELFCIRFPSVENCKTFMTTMQEVAESQGEREENKDASDTAGLLEKLTVDENKSEEKELEKVMNTEKLAVSEDKSKKKELEKVTNTDEKDEQDVEEKPSLRYIR
ncbi:Ran-binding protein 1-like b [Spatholobus suberectus]|nr:Ran-binding protein 1-like b [Spatholobus suberectus]